VRASIIEGPLSHSRVLQTPSTNLKRNRTWSIEFTTMYATSWGGANLSRHQLRQWLWSMAGL